MASGKFFFVALGSLLLYTLFIHFGYLKLMEGSASIYNVYLYDPLGTQQEVSERICPVTSLEELNAAVLSDTNGVGIDASSGTPSIVLYFGSEKADNHRADYALSLLHQENEYHAWIAGTNTPELKQRKEMCCELLFVELIAVGFLGLPLYYLKKSRWGLSVSTQSCH